MGGSLVLQVGGQKKILAFAAAHDEFIARANGSTFSFKRTSGGTVDSVEGRQNGRVVTARKRSPVKDGAG